MTGGYGVDRTRAVWWTLGAFLFVVLGWILASFVGTFVFALFVYYSTRPIYQRLERRLGSSSVAAATSLLVLALPAILLVAYTVVVGVQELSAVVDGADVQSQVDLYAPVLDSTTALEDPQSAITGLDGEQLLGIVESGLAYVGLLGSFALHLLIVIVVAYYLLRDGHRLSRWLRSRFGDDRGVMDTFFYELDRDLQIVFFGNILTAIATGVIGALAYSLLDAVAPPELSLPYAVLLGLLTGAASLIPVIGMKLVYVPVTAYLLARVYVDGLADVLWFPLAFFVVSLVIVDSIPDFFLRPYVSGRNVHLGAVMVAYIVGPLLFGWYGLFLAPLLLLVTIHFCRLVLPELLNSRRIQPYAVDPAHLGAREADRPPDPDGPESAPGSEPTSERPAPREEDAGGSPAEPDGESDGPADEPDGSADRD